MARSERSKKHSGSSLVAPHDFTPEKNLWETFCRIYLAKKKRFDERRVICSPEEADKLAGISEVLDLENWLKKFAQKEIQRLEHSGAKQDFDELCADGCNAQIVAVIVCLLRFAPVAEQLWPQVSWGPRKLHRMTRDIENAALVLEEISSTSHFPEVARDLQRCFNDFGSQMGLPAIEDVVSQLRMYVRVLNIGREISAHLKTRSLPAVVQYILVSYVKRATGAFHDKCVSGIIGAVKGPEDYNEVALRMWRNRNYRHLNTRLAIVAEILFGFGMVLTGKA